MIRFLQSGNKAAKYILGGFLTILAVSMVAYLIPGFMSNTSANTQTGIVATVAGVNIQRDEVTKLAQQMAQAQAQGRGRADLYVPFMMPRAAQELIQRQAVAYEAGRLGLMVSDQEVRDEMQKGMYKDIFFPDGKWIGQQKYEELFTQNGSTAGEFERNMKDDLLRRKLYYTIAAGVTVSPADVEKLYKEKNTKVKFQYAVVSLEEIQKQINPTESELKAFYSAGAERYKNAIPEKRQIRYFLLEDKIAEGKVTVDPAEMQRYYNSNQNEYRVPERVRVRHILITTPAVTPGGKPDQQAVDAARAKATDILKQVKAGGDFAELAKKSSQDPASAPKGGELGWGARGMWVPPFEKVAFAQEPGQISDLVQSDFGFHIIQTEEKEAGRIKSFPEVKAQIEAVLKPAQVNKFLNNTLNAVQDTAQKQGLDKAAAQQGAQVLESNPVGRTDKLPGIGVALDLMSAVFSTPENSLGAGRYPQGYVLFQVTKVVPARTPSFEEIKDRVTSDFKSIRANELLQKKIQAMAERAHVEHDLAKAAKEAGATLKTGDMVSRTSQVADLGSMSGPLSTAFDLKPGEISGSLSLGSKGAVLQVLERQEPSLTDAQFAAERDNLRDQLTDQKRGQTLQMFMGDLNRRLEKEGKLKINKAEMDNLTRFRS